TTSGAARVAMTAANALSAVLIFVLARKVAGALEAVLAAVVFAVACVPVWNMVSHHWLSTCCCLATAAVLLADRWRESGRLRPALSGALAGLTFAIQQQRGVFLGVWLAAALLLLPPSDARRRAGWIRALGWAALGWLLVVGTILGYAAWRSSIGELVEAIFTFVLFAYRPRQVGTTSWGATTWLTRHAADYTWRWLPMAVPVVLAAETALLLRRLASQRGYHERLHAAFLLLAACMGAAVLYYPDLIHVSYIVAFTLPVAAGLVSRLRSIPRFRRLDGPLRAVLAVGLLVALDRGWTNVALARAEYPLRYESAVGGVATNDFGRMMH